MKGELLFVLTKKQKNHDGCFQLLVSTIDADEMALVEKGGKDTQAQ